LEGAGAGLDGIGQYTAAVHPALDYNKNRGACARMARTVDSQVFDRLLSADVHID
jgi:hypothetical protein